MNCVFLIFFEVLRFEILWLFLYSHLAAVFFIHILHINRSILFNTFIENNFQKKSKYLLLATNRKFIDFLSLFLVIMALITLMLSRRREMYKILFILEIF